MRLLQIKVRLCAISSVSRCCAMKSSPQSGKAGTFSRFHCARRSILHILAERLGLLAKTSLLRPGVVANLGGGVRDCAQKPAVGGVVGVFQCPTWQNAEVHPWRVSEVNQGAIQYATHRTAAKERGRAQRAAHAKRASSSRRASTIMRAVVVLPPRRRAKGNKERKARGSSCIV